MKALKISGIFALVLASTSVTAFGRGGFGGRSDRSEAQIWYCRADARDDSGMFFYGVDRDRAWAYTQALEACSRAGYSCMINCSIDMNF
jgi:hypothetical protein